jgi:hypothetical protein
MDGPKFAALAQARWPPIEFKSAWRAIGAYALAAAHSFCGSRSVDEQPRALSANVTERRGLATRSATLALVRYAPVLTGTCNQQPETSRESCCNSCMRRSRLEMKVALPPSQGGRSSFLSTNMQGGYNCFWLTTPSADQGFPNPKGNGQSSAG